MTRAIAAGVPSDGVAKVKHLRAPAASRSGTRRASDKIGRLSECFYKVLCRMPGETMTVLAIMASAPG